MRIALFVHCYYPEHYFGTEAYTRLLARELQGLGCRPVVVAATFVGEPAQATPVERYEIDGIPVWRIDKNAFPHRSLAETYDQPAMVERLCDILREIDPDVVHVCHLMNHTAALLAACERLALPAFATFTDFFGFCFNNKLQAADGSLCDGPSETRDNCIACLLTAAPPQGALARRLAGSDLLRPLLSKCLAARPGLAGRDVAHIEGIIARPQVLARAYRSLRAAIAPSQFLLDAHRKNGFSPLVHSPFGIDIDRSPKPPAPGAPLRLGYIGQLAPHKGVHLLLDALDLLPLQNVSLAIYGSEAQDPGYARRLRKAAIGLQATFEGTFAPERMAEILAQIDVLVIPSTWYENSPLVLLQALATHTPVVVSDVPGLTEFIREGESGFSFARGDARALASVLRPLVADTELARRMSGMARYERTPRDMARDVLTLYTDHGVPRGRA